MLEPQIVSTVPAAHHAIDADGSVADGRAATPSPAVPKGALGAWWAQGARSAFLMRPRLDGLTLTPAVLSLLVLAVVGLDIAVERLYVAGDATFYWGSLLTNHWMGLVAWLLAAWLLVHGERRHDAADVARQTASRFAMLAAQALPLGIAVTLLVLPVGRGAVATEPVSVGPAQAVWIAALLWYYVAQSLLLWRSSSARWTWRLAAWLLVVAASSLGQWAAPVRHWYPAGPAVSEDEPVSRFRLSQEVMEAQADVLQKQLAALPPQRRGKVDVYALTFAPNADEEVFRRESEMVAGVMQQRFDARSLQLVSHRDEQPRWAWATRLNLQRAVRRIAQVMDRDEDVLFIHLTSHGARDGTLATAFWPLDVDPLTPQVLEQILAEAGIRNRIVSVSACFSGSWIAPLTRDDTLVMTAADSEHTSYGCGRKSELTFFGRAMYDEGLRATWSFEAAHAAARTVIEKREKEAGKSDGYSNPQIAVGAGIRRRLELLEKQLAASAS